jgi:hypothetical protein
VQLDRRRGKHQRDPAISLDYVLPRRQESGTGTVHQSQPRRYVQLHRARGRNHVGPDQSVLPGGLAASSGRPSGW